MDQFEGRLRNVMSRVTYKEWTWRIEQDGIGLWYLQVQFFALDAKSGLWREHAARKWRLSTHMTDSEIVQTALLAILTAEEHEVRERFLYRGKAIFEPHMNVEALGAFAQGNPEERRSPMPEVSGDQISDVADGTGLT